VWDRNAEQAVLGSMMSSSNAVLDVVAVLKPQDFYQPAHEQIFIAATSLHQDGAPVDPITCRNRLEKIGVLAKIGGELYLHELLAASPIPGNVEFYAQIVKDKAQLRRLNQALSRGLYLLHGGAGEVSVLQDQIEQAIMDSRDMSGKSGPILEEAEREKLLESLDDTTPPPQGVLTGLADIDQAFGGFKPGQMIVVAARPGVGKSALALNIATAAAVDQGLPTLFFTLEMSNREQEMRLLSARAQVKLNSLTHRKLTEEDWEKLAACHQKLAHVPLYYDDSPDMSVLDIQVAARRVKQRHGLSLIVVDYLQLIRPTRAKEVRQVEVAEISRQLKILAKTLGVPVIVLSQLNRAAVARKDHLPQIADLRESGAIEQDADVVILIHREDIYSPGTRTGEADLIIAKNRNGPTEKITAVFQGHYARFVSYQT
jgi:replicative DNA helicase